MKTLPFLGLLALASCAQQAATVATTKPAQNIVQFTQADLANAIQIAQAAGPNNPLAQMIVTCATFLSTQLGQLSSAPSPTATATAGVMTAFVTADLALTSLTNATSPAQQALYAISCGPLVTYTVNQGMTMGAQIAALGAILVPHL